MDQQQNHIVFLIAVFLALGIGILFGASMGEKALITSQIAVIEELRHEIRRHQEEVETQFLSSSHLKDEILRWEALEASHLSPLLLQDKLENVKITVVVQEYLPADLADFLDLCGCSYQALVFADTSSWQKFFSEKNVDFPALQPKAISPLLLGDALELMILGENNLPANEVFKWLAAKKLLFLKTNNLATATADPALQKQTACRGLFVTYGELDSFCLDLVQRIGQKGNTIFWINAPEEKMTNTSAGLKGVVFKEQALDSFHNRLNILESLQAEGLTDRR
ncbi:MAG: copper transporter [Dethiobacteria bacterium]|jgi:hypothetical protein